MTLRLHDTATRSVREFVPREAGKVAMYLCGLTVQSEPHIGHLRSGVSYDVLRRWFERDGYQVTFVRNITDIDDKVLQKSLEQGKPFWAIAYANEVVLDAAYRALNVLPPTYGPRATGHITEMHELIGTLIDNGHAYAADDDSGDVYFDVKSYADYGALSGQRVDEMTSAADSADRAKRDPRDFALWKGYKPEEPVEAQWVSPWGPGRPGWHIECSAMCLRYLGPEFDIHGGGLDLTFPHHENEIAQSRSAGLPFARYWVHNGLLNLGESKMGKSTGNVLDLDYITALGVRMVELRHYFVTVHYRSRIDYSDEALRESATAYRRVEGFVQRAVESVGAIPAGELPAEFTEAMNDDLNTSGAIAVAHEHVRLGNTALAKGDDDGVRAALGAVRAMLDVLGIDPLDPAWSTASTGGTPGAELRSIIDSLVALALEQRAQARTRKDWSAADAVRDQLNAAGVNVEDTPHGPRWTIGTRD
ncbi:cysteinyl-tRNA synthetase [Asanoa hainanensis]|uniref:Cysteine--tRNA ligase n=1 Tax=Asanoa hainanensis TaxID=560556 RepID=A0A239P4F9_9ACTN|nr:cysteine--tRNA ligase [Asanoa hainanensis]SNT61955.1 cysteinyl-tRNA synthetase [Asanoa hainanensis]